MALSQAYIPYGAAWATPFCRWQGGFAGCHAIELAAQATTRALSERGISPASFDALVLGTTVPQRHSFYGAPWLAALIGAPNLAGPTISQACATSVAVMRYAAHEVEAGSGAALLCLAADRTSNGPHVVYPNASNPGARPDAEDWVWDNFSLDPWARNTMVQTAENVARAEGITRQEQDEVTLLRYQQYGMALADGGAFHRRYLLFPFEVKDRKGRVQTKVDGDEGIFPTTAEGLAKLEPTIPGGVVTFGAQTHPADGNAGLVVATRDRAKAMTRDPAVEIRILSFGMGRAEKGFMARAIVPAARQALAGAGIGAGDLAAIKTHNPFAVNDVLFSRALEIPPDRVNRYGSPLVYGHPQAPTGLRAVIELVEELVLAGGGYGLFDGCAAGDTAAALVLRVDVR